MKAAVNSLTLALLDSDILAEGTDLVAVRQFAQDWYLDNAELFEAAPAPAPSVKSSGWPLQPKAPIAVDPEGDPASDGIGVVHRVSVVGGDGLTDKQRAAVSAGTGLCPNCQQPKNDHLPGCSRIDASFDNRSVTKDPLPPVQ